MQLLYMVTLVFHISTVLCFKNDIRQPPEASVNEIDNSAINREPDNNFNQDRSNVYGLKTYGGSGGYMKTDQVENNDIIPSTIAPQEEDVRPMPTTGCFGNIPKEITNNNNDNNVDNNVQPSRPLVDPIPQQFNPQNQGFGPQIQTFYPPHHRYPHFHHPHYPYYSHNPWSPWRRNMQFTGPQQFYPHNPWSPWRRQMPFVMPPTMPSFMPQNSVNRPPMIIVKLLQPIILPVAKPFYPEGGERDPDSEDVDNTQKYVTGGFQKYLNGRSHRMSFKRFGAERMKTFEDKDNGQNTFGPYKINGENVHITLKLH